MQAFVTLNDPAWVEAARGLARRLLVEGGTTDAGRVRFGLTLCLQREPGAAEAARLLALFRSEHAWYRAHEKEARALTAMTPGGAPDGATLSELAAWTVVSNVLLNLDAFLVKG